MVNGVDGMNIEIIGGCVDVEMGYNWRMYGPNNEKLETITTSRCFKKSSIEAQLMDLWTNEWRELVIKL